MDMETKLINQIYELKGIVESLSLLAEFDENFNNPVIERIEVKLSEIVSGIEKTSV